jgi:hypothetical protein
MTGSRLGRYAETGQPPGFGGDGWGQPGNYPAVLLPETFQPDFLEKFLEDFVEKISEKSEIKISHDPFSTKFSHRPLLKSLSENLLFLEFTTSPIRARMGLRSPKISKQSPK